MSETQDRPEAAAAKTPAARLGAQLRETRLGLGWELPDLAASLRIRREYLEAIEAGRMSDLPGTTYALGFVRIYASALGLSGEQMAARFRAESEEVNRKPALSFPAPVPQRGVPAGALVLLGLIILAGAYAGWYWVSEHRNTPAEIVPAIPDRLAPASADKSPPSPQVASILPTATPSPESPAAPQPPSPVAAPPAATAAPSVAAPIPAVVVPGSSSTPRVATQMPPVPPPPAPAPAPAGARVVIKATADAWVTIKQKSGPPIFNKLMHAGDSFALPADKTDLTLTTGNAGGTEVDVDGTPVQGIGASGLVRRDLFLDPTYLKSGNLPPLGHAHPKAAPVVPTDQ